MNKKLILILALTLITTTTPFEPPMHRSNPKAAKCIWNPNREHKEFTDPTNQIAGFLIFYDKKGNPLKKVDYNPITKEIRYINKARENVKKAFSSFKAIGEEFNLDVTEMNEATCHKIINDWLPPKQSVCIIS